MVRRALRLVGADSDMKKEDKVLIKPNLVNSSTASEGVTTDLRIVESLVQFVKECGVSRVVVGEGGDPQIGTDRIFEVLGVRKTLQRYGVELLDLNRDEMLKVQIPMALYYTAGVSIARTAVESTHVINVPKLKMHKIALITVGLKNLLGCKNPKHFAHKHLDEKIVDIFSILRPKLTVVDGIVGMERAETLNGPWKGKPVRMNLVVAGKDAVAVDAVSAAIMGVDPRKVLHIQLAHELKLGVGDLEEIDILGEPIEKVRKEFELPDSFKEKTRNLVRSNNAFLREFWGKN